MPPIKLKGGHETLDRRLDCLPSTDERSRLYGVAAILPKRPLRGKVWYYGGAPWGSRTNTDQGTEGACPGHGWTNELICSPTPVRFKDQAAANKFAHDRVYWEAQKIDEWEGGSYPGGAPRYEGSSVLAAAKIIQKLGYMKEYRWAFSIEETMQVLAHEGPVVVGTNWTEDMVPRPSGLLEGVKGKITGGHCYVVRGLILKPELRGETLNEPVVLMTNSWGDDWGKRGDAYIRLSDFETLTKGGHREFGKGLADVCVPVGRRQVAT